LFIFKDVIKTFVLFIVGDLFYSYAFTIVSDIFAILVVGYGSRLRTEYFME